MDWNQVLTVFAVMATNLGTIIALYCQMDRKFEEHRAENAQKVEEHRRETSQILLAIQQEIKDFHGRLCVIEERNKGK